MKRTSINHNKPTIQDLFTNKKYKIPKYQRAFAWKEENAEKFWTDIFESETTEDYFLWSILLSSSEASEHDELEVIDGQQRITTCSLFFLAFFLIYRDNVRPELANQFIYPYLRNGSMKGQFNILTLSKNNNSFYEDLISVSSYSNLWTLIAPDKSNKQMKDIVDYFWKKLKEEQVGDPDMEKIRLDNLFERFTKNVFFLEIIVPDSRQASKLFEVLNNRWSDLTEADLIRNYLLSELENKNLDSPQNLKKWDTIEENIELDNLEQFLRYASFLFSKKKDLYERVIEFSRDNSPKTLIELLAKLSSNYAHILDPDVEDGSSDEVLLLKELNLLDVTQARSVLLAAYEKYTKNDLVELIKYLLSFTLRYSILWKNPNKLEKKYAEMAYSVYNENLDLAGIKQEMWKLFNVEEFELAFIRKEFKATKMPKYILCKIENYISTWEKLINATSPENVHLEHIMPKKIEKWVLENPAYVQIHQDYVNTIGNMIILLDWINIRIKNSVFSKKKAEYDSSEIKLLEPIKACDIWGEEEIKQNARNYLNYFNQIWTL